MVLVLDQRRQTMTTAFVDRSHEDRMAFRNRIEQLGVGRIEYVGKGLTMALPVNLDSDRFQTTLAEFGLRVRTEWQFPLGTDKPPQRFRHVSWSYGGAPSCWHMCAVEPI